jgi:TIR domain
MPSVFLSYAHTDLKSAEALEHGLRLRFIAAWRDKTNLHAGDKWPKALGEAIRQTDALLLLWSAAASRSEFVELEWNIALALKKPILAVLSDETALPAVLRALHSITEREPGRVVERVVVALTALGSAPAETATGQDAIMTRLDNISQTDPQVVLQTVRVLLQQPGWTVSGPVYQAARDIHVHGERSEKKSLADHWKVWVGIAVGVLTAGTLVKQFVFDASPIGQRTESPTPVSQQISGIVMDETDTLINGAKVALVGSSESTVTRAGGRFSLPAYGQRPNDLVRLSVTKDGFRPLSEYYPIRQDVYVMLHRD